MRAWLRARASSRPKRASGHGAALATEATKSGRAVLQTEMLRRQIPLAPRFVNTHFGLQGQTARKGMLAYCQKPKGMSDGDYFLAIYVLLSRATKLDDLLLVACLRGSSSRKACWRCLCCSSG